MLQALLAVVLGASCFILGWRGHNLYNRRHYRFTRRDILRYRTRLNSRRVSKTLRQLRRKTSLVRKANRALDVGALFEVGPGGF